MMVSIALGTTISCSAVPELVGGKPGLPAFLGKTGLFVSLLGKLQFTRLPMGLLKSLDLSSNRVHCQGGRTLAAAIDGAGTLRELNLAGNLMKSAGAQAIVDLLGSKWTHPLSPASVFFYRTPVVACMAPSDLIGIAWRHEMTQRKKNNS